MATLIKLLIGFGSLWDGFTTVFVTHRILGPGRIQLFASMALAFVVLGLLFSTEKILAAQGRAKLVVRGCWALALIYDLYTSYVGNSEIILGGDVRGARFLLLIVLTLLTTGLPMFPAVAMRRISR